MKTVTTVGSPGFGPPIDCTKQPPTLMSTMRHRVDEPL
jgi:hypothetical protein